MGGAEDQDFLQRWSSEYVATTWDQLPASALNINRSSIGRECFKNLFSVNERWASLARGPIRLFISCKVSRASRMGPSLAWLGGASEFCGTTSFLEYLEHKNELGVSSRAKTGDNLQLETDQEEFFCCVISVSGSAGVKMPSENKDGRCWWKLSSIEPGWMVLIDGGRPLGNGLSRV